MTDELDKRRLETTHGIDGARLGTEFCVLYRGDYQCPYVKQSGDAWLQCVLIDGHAHGHRDYTIGAQEPQNRWEFREVLAKKRNLD